MPRIDVFLKTLARLGASGMTLRSGQNLVLHFPTGDRPAVQKIGHADLTALVNEVAPPDAQAALYMERPVTFEVPFAGRQWSLAATPLGSALSLRIQESEGAAPTPNAPGPEGAHQREASAMPPPAPAPTPAPAPAPAPIPAPEPATALAEEATDFSSLVQTNTFEADPAALSGAGIPLAEPSSSLEEPAPTLEPTSLGSGLSLEEASLTAAAPQAAVEPAPAGSPAVAEKPTTTLPAVATSPAPAPQAWSPPVGGGVVVPTPRVAARGLIDRLLVHMSKVGASDLHLTTGSKPFLRLHGEMHTLDDQPVLSEEMLYAEIYAIMPPRNREEFARRNDTDFAHEITGLSRYRVNVFRDRFGPGSVLRAIPFEILPPEKLGLPKEVLQLCYLTKGLVLVTGPTGSGKSTTLATLIDYINVHRSDHIITIEDPIEFVHGNKKCLVNQREVHLHTDSFKDALRAALREDPDIVLVGEMRDLETIAIAVETAETGHLVFGTLHTTTAPSTVDRVIDQFPADRQDQIRQMLAESLKGVIAQVLCRKVGGGRVAAYEILIGTKAVSNLIRERKTFQLPSLMQTGKAQGMRTLNDSLIDMVRRKLVEPKEAYMKAVDKGELANLLKREGIEMDWKAEE